MTLSSKGTATADNAMSPQELESFLHEARVARLATIRRDGAPHLTPVWFAVESGALCFCLEQSRLHLRNLADDPRATALIDIDNRTISEPDGDAAGVMFRGTMTMDADPARVEPFRRRLLRRYRPASDVPAVADSDGTDPMAYVMCTMSVDQTLSWDFSKG